MKYRRTMAFTLAAAMMVGSSMAVFAADVTGSATGTGTSFDHVDKEVTSVTLPTDAAVAHVFDYYIDPERIINSAEKLTDGTGVTANADGVYFKNAGTAAVNGTVASNIAADTNTDYIVTVSDMATNAEYKYDGTKWQVKKEDGSYEDTTVTIDVKESDGTTAGTLAANDTVTVSGASAAGAASYSSSSDVVKFEGKNSVDVDVSVSATMTATNAEKDIKLVEDTNALAAATTPALLMTLTVGSDTKNITSAGATAKATIQGVPTNFAVKVENDKYVYGPKADVDPATWKSTTVQLTGKTNQKDIPSGEGAMTVPQITLTWTIAKHVDYTDATAHGNWSGRTLWLAKDASTGFSSNSLTVEVSDGGTTYTRLASGKFVVDSNNWVSVTWDNIIEALGGEPAGTAYVRIIDGTTRYTFANN